MELKEGYKQTEVGVIPEDWDVVLIENIAEIKTGDKNTQDKNPSGRYPFFVRSQNVERIDNYSFDCEAVLTAGDGVGTGKVFHYINGKFDVHQRVYIINNFSDKILGYFFFLYFSSHFYNRIIQMTAKSSVDSVRRDMIAEMPIALPPLISEQLAISTALSDMDALLSSLDALISKKRDIKKGAMQELLTGKKRLPGFTKSWRTLRFGQCALQIREFASPENGVGFCIELENIAQNSGNLVGELSSLANASSIKLKFQENDILFGRLRAYLRKFYYAKFSGACSSEIWVLRAIENNIVPPYLFQIIQTEGFIAAASVTYGTHMPRTDWNVIKNFLVHLPSSLKEQAAIAAVLSDMDAEIAALEARRAKVLALKLGMMQELLTGRTRLLPEGERHG